jgi:sodium/potassium-transporting ATPase subunit alpha
VQPINAQMRSEFDRAYTRFGSSGRRVLGFAYSHFEAEADTVFNKDAMNFSYDGLVFVGLAAIMDPPKDGVKEAISKCHTARIKVFMVTGDHPLTATAIARQV